MLRSVAVKTETITFTDAAGDMSAARRFSPVGLTIGTLLLACSLTPSLVPRSVAFQGVVSGLSLTLGYVVGRAGDWLWSYLELPVPDERHRRHVAIAVAAICAVVAIAFLARATEWQNDVRAIMGLDDVSGVRPFSVGLIAMVSDRHDVAGGG